MKTAKITKAETARLLRAVQRIARHAGHEHAHQTAIAMIVTLTDLLDGVRFDLVNDHDERLRKATVDETIESVMSHTCRGVGFPAHGWLMIDSVACYVDC